MKVYKIRHKPTGLFYKPGPYRSKNNLSKKGKTYTSMPSFGHIYSIRIIDEEKSKGYWKEYKDTPFVQSDWEIVEYLLVEQRVVK